MPETKPMTPVLPATDAEIDELRNGLVDVLDGPWLLLLDEDQTPIEIVQDDNHDMRVCFPTSNDPATANHIARCSPDRIRALLARLDAAERDRDAWFNAAFKISGSGMSKRTFIDKYKPHLGVSEETAARMRAALEASQ